MRRSTHLNDAQVVDAVDDRPDTAGAAHLAECATCDARVRDLRVMLQRAATVDVPEPSPLFWDQFPVRVSRAIEAPTRGGWRIATPRLWGSAVAAAIIVVVLLLPMDWRAGTPAPDPKVSDTPPATDLVAANLGSVPDLDSSGHLESFEDDEAWAMVRAVAEESDYEAIQAMGLTARAGSLERAAIELTSDERAELARLIEQEISRTGASTP